ncbi:MAG: hypothetical protein IT454_09450 [Planctomycetes bacterium]|nr:hypothetical protein [Planctomycetota bacterium]
MKSVVAMCAFVAALSGTTRAQLFVGQSDSSVMTKVADVSALPAVSFTDKFPFDVQGAARGAGNTVYLCSGFFTTQLYTWNQVSAPVATVQVQVSGGVYGLGYAGGKLYGFANYASPMGIYEIDPSTGAGTLKVDTSAQGYRFFALDGNQADGMLYGFTEYGSPTGLYRIDPNAGTLTFLQGSPPNSYGMCRGMAVGGNRAFMVATHPTDSFYSYDLGQGAGGVYVPFTNPYPSSQNGGGAWLGPVSCSTPTTYCTVGTTVSGCSPAISFAGSPSASASSGFTLTSANVDAQRTGLFFYAVANPGFIPVQWGMGNTSYLCVKAPTQRMNVQSSGGTTGCTGAFASDWNAFMATNPGAFGNPRTTGARFEAQLWMRDPLSTKTTILSNALRFDLCP